ncbi:MAG TPA: thermonuclease family protein [Candidatus Polarisedimenticolaceae bacterium]|nr:thermonuclease family protein [Candidatus Polarisedimenticolaceae bacterium]
MSRRLQRNLLTLVILLSLSAFGISVSQEGSLAVPRKMPPAPPGYFPVASVADGDTIGVTIAGKAETVRLIGIDTPETKDPRKPVQCFGKAASAQAHKLLDGQVVRLEGDPASSDRDKYQRLLRYVYLQDGTLINLSMIENGYAFAYTLFPFTKIDEFRAAEQRARTANAGLWAGCDVRKEGQKSQTQDQP